jgi:hypothetical protein
MVRETVPWGPGRGVVRCFLPVPGLNFFKTNLEGFSVKAKAVSRICFVFAGVVLLSIPLGLDSVIALPLACLPAAIGGLAYRTANPR